MGIYSTQFLFIGITRRTIERKYFYLMVLCLTVVPITQKLY